MVIGLHLPFQSSPLDGMSAKSQSVDSEAFRSLSFGEILKAKEKQLQQEQSVSASSVAAALANLQTLLMAKPSIPEIEISDNAVKVDTQLGGQTNGSNLKPQQVNPSTPWDDGLPQLGAHKTLNIDLPATPQTVTERSIPTEKPVPISDTSQNIQAESSERVSAKAVYVETPQSASANFSKAAATVPLISKDITNEVTKVVTKPAVRAEATQVNQTKLETPPDRVATQLEKPDKRTKIVEPQVNRAEPTIETSGSVVTADIKNETDRVEVRPNFQASAHSKASPQSLTSNLSPSQVEAKDVKPHYGTISQPVKVSDSSTSDAVLIEMNTEDTIDQFVSPSSTQIEVPNATQDQYSSVQTEFIQKTIPFESKQIESPADTPARTADMSGETPVQGSSVQIELDQNTTPFTSEQVERPVSTISSRVETAHAALDRNPDDQSPIAQEANTFTAQRVENPAHTAISKTETSKMVSSQPSFVQVETAQETILPAFEQVEQPMISSAPIIQSHDATPVPHFAAQSVTRQGMTSFVFEQPEKPLHTNSSTVEAPGEMPTQYSSNRPETTPFTSDPAENLANTSPSQFSAADSTLAQVSIAQTNAEPKTTPFAAKRAEELVNKPVFQTSNAIPVQHSVDQFATGGELVTHASEPEIVSSINVAPETQESTLDSEIPVSPVLSFSKETVINTEKSVTQTVKREEAPAINPVQLTSDPQAKIVTEANQSAETEPIGQLRQSELTNSKTDTNNDHRAEKTVPPVPVPAKPLTPASIQSGIKLPPSQTPPDDVTLTSEKTRVEMKTDETIQSNAVRESANDVIGNNETYHFKTSEQTLQNKPTVSLPDKSTNHEINKVVRRAALNKEAVDVSTIAISSEIPLSNAIEFSESTSKAQRAEINDHSPAASVTNGLINKEENIQKSLIFEQEVVLSGSNVDPKTEELVALPTVHLETTATSIAQTQTMPEMDLSIPNANQEIIDVQVDVAQDEVYLPSQNGESETESSITKNTHTRRVISQAAIDTKAGEPSQVQDLPETLLTKDIKISEEVVDNLKEVKRQNDQTDVPIAKAPIAEDVNADKVAVSERSGASSAANTVRFEHTTETFVPVSFTQSNLHTIPSVEFTQDIPFERVTESKKTMTQTGMTDQAMDVAQPKVDPTDAARSSWTNVSDSAGEDLGFQNAEAFQSLQSFAQNDTIVFNANSGNDAEITSAQTTVSHAEEIETVANQPEIDALNAPINAEQEEAAVESKTVKTRVSITTSSVEISQPSIEFSASAKHTLSTNANTNSIEVLTETADNMVEVAINSDRPVIDTMKAQISKEQQPFTESKITEPQIDTSSARTPQSTVETSTVLKDLPTPPAENETSEVETQTAVRSEKIATPIDRSKPDIMQPEVGIEHERTVFETTTFIVQKDADIPLSEVQQSMVPTTFTTETNMGSEPDAVVHQATGDQGAGQVLPLRTTGVLPETQTTANQEEFISESKSVEAQINTFGPVESLQSSFDVPVETIVIPETNINNAEPENQAAQPAPSVDEAESLVSNSQPLKLTSESVETKNAEKQVNVDTQGTAFSQSPTKRAENSEAATATHVDTSEADVISVESNEKLTASRIGPANESKVMSNKESLPVSPSNNNDDHAQPGIFTKVETDRQVLKTKPAISKDEEILPAEKQPKQNQMSEPVAAATGSIKEVMTAEVNGKAPSVQVNAQAADVAQQVIHEMNVKLKSGPSSMHLQLNPKELGTIDVEMVSTPQGVRVTFFAEQSNTGKLLETQLNQLRESLIDSGVQLSGLNISQHGPSEQKGGFFSQDQNFTQFPHGDIPQSEPNIKETSRTERITRQSGEVDYLI